MKFEARNIAASGILPDATPIELPPGAFSNGNNVRFVDGKVKKFKGQSIVFGTPPITPIFVFPVKKNENNWWFYANQNDIYSTNGTSHANISVASESYSAILDLNWKAVNLPGGVVVLNNGIDAPQQWTGSSFDTDVAALGAWPSGMTARAVGAFKSHLFAANIDENDGNGRNPQLLRWSNEADPGSVPTSWDYTNPAVNAGRTTIGESDGEIIDFLQIRDSLAIYRQNDVWMAQLVGGILVFSFFRAFSQVGVLSRNCAKDFLGNHVVFSFDDLIVHDGQSPQSIAERRVRKNLFANIDGTNFERSFVVNNYAEKEIWFCYPESGNDFPNVAWVWGWQDNTWGKRDLPTSGRIERGVVNESIETFDGSSGTFDGDTDTFDSESLSGAKTSLLMADSSNGLLLKAELSETFNGSLMNSFVERLGVPLSDMNNIKFVREVRPRIKGTVGGVINIYVGSRDELEDDTAYKGPFPFTIGTSRKINCRVSGRVIDIKFESTTDIEWALSGYSIEFRSSGQR